MTVFETPDLTAASYAVAILGLVATSVLLLLGSGWVGRPWKLPVALCALAAIVGVGAAFEGRAAWAMLAGRFRCRFRYWPYSFLPPFTESPAMACFGGLSLFPC